jgi:hypothetical protein
MCGKASAGVAAVQALAVHATCHPAPPICVLPGYLLAFLSPFEHTPGRMNRRTSPVCTPCRPTEPFAILTVPLRPAPWPQSLPSGSPKCYLPNVSPFTTGYGRRSLIARPSFPVSSARLAASKRESFRKSSRIEPFSCCSIELQLRIFSVLFPVTRNFAGERFALDSSSAIPSPIPHRNPQKPTFPNIHAGVTHFIKGATGTARRSPWLVFSSHRHFFEPRQISGVLALSPTPVGRTPHRERGAMCPGLRTNRQRAYL